MSWNSLLTTGAKDMARAKHQPRMLQDLEQLCKVAKDRE